ncbi:MAG: 50S ribosomal protein L11 methyltransferase [Desulfuromusa sp.]|jgi:ribosomal protein L11 methyltransferase|nr:50S ribosomal protein L11 methyltransferase [Desulfuromusa sp.]
MKNEWIVIEVKVKGEFVDLISAVLAEHGSSGTVVEELNLDTFVVPDSDLNLSGDYVLQAYFDAVSDPQQLVSEVEIAFRNIPVLKKQNITFKLGASIRMEDWAEDWKQNFSAFHIGNHLVVRPSWEDYIPQLGEVVIEIDPGMAFGTGTHGTTQLCLEVIAELLDRPDPPVTMLDVGTGSGILALGAAALGCQKVVANDLDPVACIVARENINKNHFDEQIEISEQPLEKLPGRFDLIVANILAEENIRLRQAFMEHMRPGGWLVLSGILKEKEPLVRAGFADLALEFFPSRYQEEWVCLILRRSVMASPS